MPELVNDKKIFSLKEVTQSIQKTLTDRYRSSFWVKAEMNKLNHYTHSGHCYPELVEKKDGKVVAQIKSMLWKNDYRRINNHFLAILKEPLKDGITILIHCTVHFDSSYGLCLRIHDIDPSFSLGELEREKQETIQRLHELGIYHANKKLTLPLLPQRIAVISVETSKGFADYLKVIEHNPWGYKYFNFLFPALLQGERSVASILGQLRVIKKVIRHFDAVAIIRGGGGDVGLSSYNNFELAKEVATFPIPVLTGIGHSTNETVVEMISHRNAITPTELADFLIQAFHNVAEPIRRAEEVMQNRVRRVVQEQHRKLNHTTQFLQSIVRNNIIKATHNITSLGKTLVHACAMKTQAEHFELLRHSTSLKTGFIEFIDTQQSHLDRQQVELMKMALQYVDLSKTQLHEMERTVSILDPVNILKRGYSITCDHQGKVVSSIGALSIGDAMSTAFADGSIVSQIISIELKKEE